MVVRASEQRRVGREINKTLDEKYAAMLRKVGGEQDGERLAGLWDDFCARGLVAGAYWAIMSHAHVAEELKVHAFGEVHMLSHFMGGFNRHAAKELWAAERRMQQLADRLARARRQGQETIAARDQRIGALEQELNRTRYELVKAYAERARGPAAALPGGARQRRGERRLAAARARMQALEAENQRLKALLGVLTDVTLPPAATEPEQIATAAESVAAVEDKAAPPEGRCVLYVGGRCQLLPHLRARAAACNACLLHHDGGQEETLQSLGGLVDRADVVFCPIDCVSHQACLKVKSLCRRRAKPFVPLRRSSATCFSQAMRVLQSVPAPHGSARS
jgi:HAMP domain-containing protein